MRQVHMKEIDYCLDEYLINIDREPIHVKVSGANCPDAVIISHDEFSRLKHMENSFQAVRFIIKRLANSAFSKKANKNISGKN